MRIALAISVMSVDPDLLRDFLLESREVLQRLDRDLVELERNPADQARLKEIFRSVHTVKGTSSFLALHHLERLAHAGESLMDRLREGVLTLDAEMTSALLAMVDAIRNMVGEVEASGTDGEDAHDELVEKLLALAGEDAEADDSAPTFVSARKSNASEVISKAAIAVGAIPVSESTLRVDVGLLDHVMALIKELGLVRNQLAERTTQDETLALASQQLDRLTNELHQSLLKTRVQAIGTVWNRFPRIVRDLAIICGKKVEVELSGTATELDRTIIEAIKDPLTHLVRNSVDHGLESPEVRVASGKSATGRLRLDAYREGNQVSLEVADDGSGINLERVRQTALERQLVSSEMLSKMADQEVMQLIFAPGFSTAQKVTTISGRGVGMDVVKTNIERIGGTVELRSEAGKGTTIKIKLQPRLEERAP